MVSITTQSNYLAKIFKISGIRKHSNADRLQCVAIDGFNAITGLEAKDGDFYVFFPAECQINSGLLAFSNSYRDKTKNRDHEKAGFVEENRRIKTISLRKERSEGYILPIIIVEEWLASIGIKVDLKEFEGKYFDTIGKEIICNKYVVKVSRQPGLGGGNKKGKKARESKLVEGQFHFHYDTDALQKNMHKISPDDILWISSKYHGTSAVYANVLCKRKLNIFEKMLRKIPFIKIEETKYDFVYSSRSVVKNQYADKPNEGFYDSNVWENEFKKLQDKIPAGVTLYGEIVGYTPSGSAIQKMKKYGSFDYGCLEGCSKFLLYRATFTNGIGQTFDFSYTQLKEFASKYGIELVETLYYGKAIDMFDISTEEHWHEEFINKLSEKYLEKYCHLCKNEVPYEGIVVKVDGITPNAYKLKSFMFREAESNQLDTGEVDMEEAN